MPELKIFNYNGPAYDIMNEYLGRYNIVIEAIDAKQALCEAAAQIKAYNSLDAKKDKIRLNKDCLQEYIGNRQALTEDTRIVLANKSRTMGLYKDQSHGKNRFDRKKFSKIANTVKAYNKIDMNELFKRDELVVGIPVIGETDTYTVSIKITGVIAELQKGIKSNSNKLEYKTVIQALTKRFNTSDVYVKCTCPDYTYRFAHWNIVNNVSVDDTAHDPGPGKGVANPYDDQGRGCKHVMLVLANGDWMMKVASVINNYIHYASQHLQKPFLKLIFPKLYGVAAEDAAEAGLVETESDLLSNEDLIKMINDWARTRGQFKKGSNKNPAKNNEEPAEEESTEQAKKEEPKEEPEPETEDDSDKDKD